MHLQRGPVRSGGPRSTCTVFSVLARSATSFPYYLIQMTAPKLTVGHARDAGMGGESGFHTSTFNARAPHARRTSLRNGNVAPGRTERRRDAYR